MSCCHVFSFVAFVATLLYLVFSGWLYQALLLILFNTWPIGLPCFAVDTWPKRRLNVEILGFIECYGDVDTESLCLGENTSKHLQLGIALFGPCFFTSLMISTIMTCCPSSKLSCTRQWVGPRKSPSSRAPYLLRPALGICISWIQEQTTQKALAHVSTRF